MPQENNKYLKKILKGLEKSHSETKMKFHVNDSSELQLTFFDSLNEDGYEEFKG